MWGVFLAATRRDRDFRGGVYGGMLVCYRIERHWHTLLDIRGANDAGLLSPHQASQFFGFCRGLPAGARLEAIRKRDVQVHAGKECCQATMGRERSIYNEGALGCPASLGGFAEVTVWTIGAQ